MTEPVAAASSGDDHHDVSDLAALFGRLPVGWSVVTYAGRRYGVSKTVELDGRSVKVFAEELGGTDVVSANLYLTSAGPAFRPCEMPADKVTAFLAGLELR